MAILKKFYRQNLIQIYTKTHQIAPFKKNSRGSIPPPPYKCETTSKFHNLKKNCPPLPNPGYAYVDIYRLQTSHYYCDVCNLFDLILLE